MIKNDKTNSDRIKLNLRKETVAHLTSDMLRIVAGGAINPTRSLCATACTSC